MSLAISRTIPALFLFSALLLAPVFAQEADSVSPRLQPPPEAEMPEAKMMNVPTDVSPKFKMPDETVDEGLTLPPEGGVEAAPQPPVNQAAPLEDLEETQEAQTEQVEEELEEVETKIETRTEAEQREAEAVQDDVEEGAKEGVPVVPATDETPEAAEDAPADAETEPTDVLTPADTVPGTETAEIPPEDPITRAYFATRLIKTLGFKLPPEVSVSEFPFYRDVPRGYSAYNAIELARERGLMTQDEIEIPAGFFSPKKTMIYSEVFRVLEQSLTGNLPPVDASRTIIEPFEDAARVSDELAPVVAKLTLIGVLRPAVDKKLLPEEEVTREKLDVLLERTAARLAIVRFRLPPQPQEYPQLPVGESVVIEPTSVILREGLAPGDTLYFAVAVDTATFAKGGRFRGKVVARQSENVYTVELDEFESTTGENYQTKTRFNLTFQREEGFFAPGDHISVETGGSSSPAVVPATP